MIILERSSIVLGIDWLKSYGKVTFDFSLNSITITMEDQLLELKGIEEGAKLKLISVAQWNQEMGNGECYLISSDASSKGAGEDTPIHPTLQQVLEHYQDVFLKPKTLPPPRSQDHQILLQSDSVPVNVRSYRYSYEQKG